MQMGYFQNDQLISMLSTTFAIFIDGMDSNQEAGLLNISITHVVSDH